MATSAAGWIDDGAELRDFREAVDELIGAAMRDRRESVSAISATLSPRAATLGMPELSTALAEVEAACRLDRVDDGVIERFQLALRLVRPGIMGAASDVRRRTRRHVSH